MHTLRPTWFILKGQYLKTNIKQGYSRNPQTIPILFFQEILWWFLTVYMTHTIHVVRVRKVTIFLLVNKENDLIQWCLTFQPCKRDAGQSAGWIPWPGLVCRSDPAWSQHIGVLCPKHQIRPEMTPCTVVWHMGLCYLTYGGSAWLQIFGSRGVVAVLNCHGSGSHSN